MAWPVAALIGAAASIGGGMMGNRAQIAMQNRAQDFEREMSNTAHQREVADLRAAGLNPVLSSGGKGASTPNVPPGNVAELYKNVGSEFTKGYEADLKRDMQSMQKENVAADTKIKNATEENVVQDTLKKIEEKNWLAQQTDASRTGQRLTEKHMLEVDSKVALNKADELLRAAQKRLTELEQEKVAQDRIKSVSETAKNYAEMNLAEKRSQEITESIQKIRQEVLHLKATLPKAQALTPFWEGVGEATHGLKQSVVKAYEQLKDSIDWKGADEFEKKFQGVGEWFGKGVGTVFGGQNKAGD